MVKRIVMLFAGAALLGTHVLGQQAAPASSTLTVRKGTTLKLATLQPLDPLGVSTGDDVPLLLAGPLQVDGITLLNTKEMLHGKVTSVKPPGPHCTHGEVKWKLDRITFADGSTARTRVSSKSQRPNDWPRHNPKSSTAPDRLGQVSEDIIMGPIVVVVLAEMGVIRAIKKPFRHGACSAYTKDFPLPANASVEIEVLEEHTLHH